MEERPKYFSKRKPVKCPDCAGKKVVHIMYGYPTDETIENANDGSFVMGGCVVSGCDPSWRCTACGASIYREELRRFFREDSDL